MIRVPFRVALAAGVLIVAACSGDDGSSQPTATGGGAATTSTPASTSPTEEGAGETDGEGTAQGSSTTGTAGQVTSTDNVDDPLDLDVCTVLPGDDVADAIGKPVGAGRREDAAPYLGCRYEAAGSPQIVTVGVIPYPDAEQAEESFDFAADQYPAVEGVGDRAYNSQPIADISVLSGRYEVSVGLYFVDDDDARELTMARDLAAILLDRLP